jgi:nicotinamide mononucleotide transporter
MFHVIIEWLNSPAFELFAHPTTWAELFGFVTGLLSVALVALNRISTFGWGMLNAFFFLVLFYDAHLFADGTLQVMFFVLNVLGWWAWLRAGPNRTALHVERAGWKFWAMALVGLGVMMAIEVPILQHVNDTYVYFDAFILAASVSAQFLMSFKKIENWYWWITVDIISIPLYFVKDLYLTGIVYVLFMALCFVCLYQWNKILKGEKVDQVAEPVNPSQVALAIVQDPEFRRNMDQADRDFAAGKTRPLSEILEELR